MKKIADKQSGIIAPILSVKPIDDANILPYETLLSFLPQMGISCSRQLNTYARLPQRPIRDNINSPCAVMQWDE
jgi:hypothetical protein